MVSDGYIPKKEEIVTINDFKIAKSNLSNLIQDALGKFEKKYKVSVTDIEYIKRYGVPEDGIMTPITKRVRIKVE